MFVYKDGKLYIKRGDTFVGVDCYPDRVVVIDGTETNLRQPFRVQTKYAILASLQITEDSPYIFPRPKQEVVEDDEKPKRGRPKKKE